MESMILGFPDIPLGGTVILEIAPEEVRKTRSGRRFLWGLLWSVFAFVVVASSAFHLLGVQGSEALPRLYAAVALPAAAVAIANLTHVRTTVQAVNPVAVSERGLYPPFKPKRRLTKEDWFVPYKDIVSMEPVAEKKGLIPAYNMTLKDGLRFQLNALDLLLYVDEAEIRRYERTLRLIREDLSKPENCARAARDEDVIIPKERFESAQH